MKILIKLFIIMMAFFSSGEIKAQDPATAASVVKGLYTAAKWTHDHWTTISWYFHGRQHTWWACIYQDGFVTYNDFRSYRTSMDAYNYFVKGRGDCDAVYGNGNQHICYESPMQAKKYAQQHGPIVDIKYQDKNGNYHSVFDY